jgi:hypothetical protein
VVAAVAVSRAAAAEVVDVRRPERWPGVRDSVGLENEMYDFRMGAALPQLPAGRV